MNKRELLKKMVQRSGSVLTIEQAEMALSAFITETIAAVKSDDNVTLLGFGTFKTFTPRPRFRKNKLTGEKEIIEPKTRMKFIPGKALKDLLAKPVDAVLPSDPSIKQKNAILRPTDMPIFYGVCHHGPIRRHKRKPLNTESSSSLSDGQPLNS